MYVSEKLNMSSQVDAETYQTIAIADGDRCTLHVGDVTHVEAVCQQRLHPRGAVLTPLHLGSRGHQARVSSQTQVQLPAEGGDVVEDQLSAAAHMLRPRRLSAAAAPARLPRLLGWYGVRQEPAPGICAHRRHQLVLPHRMPQGVCAKISNMHTIGQRIHMQAQNPHRTGIHRDRPGAETNAGRGIASRAVNIWHCMWTLT